MFKKVETYLCGVEQTNFKKMSIEKVEKAETYRTSVEKLDTYLNWIKQSRKFLLDRESRNLPKFIEKVETYQFLAENVET